MRNIFHILGSLYSRWTFTPEIDSEAPIENPPRPAAGRSESPEEELHRMRKANAQAREKIKYFRKSALRTLARGYEESLQAIGRRIQALEIRQRPAS